MPGTIKPQPLIPLLYWVERVERNTHETFSDSKAEAYLMEYMSAEVNVEVNKKLMNFDDYKALLLERRSKYIFFDFQFLNPVTVVSDEDGRAGTVAFGMKVRTQGKEDNKQYNTDVNVCWQVGWFPDSGHPAGGRRMITKVTGALGEWVPLA
ncbi:hypothetical protein FE257_010710 [Aspergillus nanangensis]|uniref:Uncharacterized protein n=1 Tax=Aspergillus nanangensis TaxID=2582783 RepID=A0AAD4CI42_ASPNN|nr:hypothetical protein FE257_010710 [Aspergillus nanangensis]